MGDNHKDCSVPVSENVKKDQCHALGFLELFILDIDLGLLYYPPCSKMFYFREIIMKYNCVIKSAVHQSCDPQETSFLFSAYS